jgi:hypothetical protein
MTQEENMTATGVGKRARIWLSDGSGAPTSDLYQLSVTHPTLLGRAAPYKGTIDAMVPVGTAIVDAARADDILFPEAEWCLTFPTASSQFFDDSQLVNLATPVVVQGLIEGKWLNRLSGTLEWRPASIGNNLLADGPGIVTTLGAIEASEQGEVLVSYQYAHGDQAVTRTQRTTLPDLRRQNILELVRAVLAHGRETQQAIDWIDFSAMGTAAAIVNEPARLQAAMRAIGRSPSDLATVAGFQQLADRFIQDILAEGIGIPAGNPITIAVRDQHGTIVGQGQLTWVHL